MTKLSKNTQVSQCVQTDVMRSAKVRMWKIDSVLTGTHYRIEVKKWYGWVQPSISYSEDGQFYSLKEAEKWFKYLSGEKDIKVLYAVS
jgi:hypothetical protein